MKNLNQNTKQKAAVTLLENNRSWESIHACIQLDIFQHINWSETPQLIVSLARKVQERSAQDRKAALVFWEALRSNNVRADVEVGKTPLWMQMLFGGCVHVFKAMVEKDDIPAEDLNILSRSAAFEMYVLQDKEWGVLAQISSESFAWIKQWANKHRQENLWMLSTSTSQLYKARPDFADGIPSEEIKRWAVQWATQKESSAHVKISNLLFQNKEKFADELSPTQRKDVVEALTVDNWKQLALTANMAESDWLKKTDVDLSLSAVKKAFAAWKSIPEIYSQTDRVRCLNFMRPYLKRVAKNYLKNNPDNQEVFECLLSVWDGAEIQIEEMKMLDGLMRASAQLSAPWTWPEANPSHVVLAVNAFLQSASDQEIQNSSRPLCEFALKALSMPSHNDRVSALLSQMMFEQLKEKDADSAIRPHLAQILWMSTFMSPHKALIQRCSRWNGLKKAEQFRPNLKVFYAPVYEDLMEACFDKMQLKKLKPEQRSTVEKMVLEYHVNEIAKAPTVKSVRKM